MLRILALDQGEHLGGAERFLSELLTRLPDDQYEVHLLTTPDAKTQALYKNSSVELHGTEMPALKPLGITKLFTYRNVQKKLSSIIEEVKPDLILSNTVRTHLLVSPVSSKKNIPLIWMVHDLTFPRILLKRFVKYPRQIIACSEYVKDFYSAPEKTPVIYPFGIDDTLLDSLRASEKQKIIGMVGKFIPWKGQDLFIEVISAIHQEFPEYRFEILGSVYEGNDVSEKYFSTCLEMIKEYGLQDFLKVKSYVHDVYQVISSWELLLHCSTQPEPLGRVVAEGMAAGCSVVCSDLGGPKELIDDEVNGRVVSPDKEALVGVLRKLLSNPQEKRQFSKNAREKIERMMLWDAQMKRFEGVLKKAAQVS